MSADLCIYCGHIEAAHIDEYPDACSKFRDQPDDPDGEDFRGGESAAYERDQQAERQKLK